MMPRCGKGIEAGSVWISYLNKNKDFCRKRFIVCITNSAYITGPVLKNVRLESTSKRILIPANWKQDLGTTIEGLIQKFVAEQDENFKFIDMRWDPVGNTPS